MVNSNTTDISDQKVDDDNISHINCNYYQVDEISDSCPSNFKYKAMHLNIRSLNENSDRLKILIADLESNQTEIDFLLLCETFLTDISAPIHNINGYKKK